MGKRSGGRELKRQAQAAALAQGGVIAMSALRELGLSYSMIRGEVAAGRWVKASPGVIVGGLLGLEGGVLADRTGGFRSYRGTRRHHSAGVMWLARIHRDTVHISGPRGAQFATGRFVTAHHLRSADATDVIGLDLRRVRSEVAALRAAMWASTPTSGATLLAMAAQQRLVRPSFLQDEVVRLPRNARRSMIARVVEDLVKGAQALSELEFGELCHRYGLPQPTRQAVVRQAKGNTYLDVRWEAFGVVVEIDGAHHFAAQHEIQDMLRHNDIGNGGHRPTYPPHRAAGRSGVVHVSGGHRAPIARVAG